MNYRGIDISKENSFYICTKGLEPLIEKEFKLKSFGNMQGEIDLLCFLIDYIINDAAKIRSDETISYGLWLVKFVGENEFYEIYELDELFETWTEGADNAIYYMEQQKVVCEGESAEFKVPQFTQKIAISQGVLEGLRVQGIRYTEPPPMSGWYLTTHAYDGDIRNMSVVSLQTIVIKRKDLLQFLALPPGFVFEITENNTCRIWKTAVDH